MKTDCNHSLAVETVEDACGSLVRLDHHSVYYNLLSPERIACFVESHCFVVWDFVNLARALQRQLADTRQLVAMMLLDELVAGCDDALCDRYQNAVTELGADLTWFRTFRDGQRDCLPADIEQFSVCGQQLAETGSIPELTAAFFLGSDNGTAILRDWLRYLHPPQPAPILDTLGALADLEQLRRDRALQMVRGLCPNPRQAIATALGVQNRHRALWDATLQRMLSLPTDARCHA